MARWFDSVVVLAVSAAFAFLSHHDGSWLGKQNTDSSPISRPQATEMTFGATWDVSGLKRVPCKSWKIGETNITKVFVLFGAHIPPRTAVQIVHFMQIATLRVPVVFENSPAAEWAEQVDIVIFKSTNGSDLRSVLPCRVLMIF
jgi:hypothetical protein